jgi:hypothetical protein
VIYKPEDGNVMKYSISEKNANGVTPTSQDTLISSNFSQTNTTTIMEYVMLMNGPSSSNLDIIDGVPNSFVFAFGEGNTFGYHQGRGTFSLDLGTSSPTKVPTTPIPTSVPTTTRSPTRPPSKKPRKK